MMIRRVKKTRKDPNWRLERIPETIQIMGISNLLYTIETHKGLSGLVYGDIVKSLGEGGRGMFIGVTRFGVRPFVQGCFVNVPRSLTSSSTKDLGKMYFISGMPFAGNYPIHTESKIVENRFVIEQVEIPN